MSLAPPRAIGMACGVAGVLLLWAGCRAHQARKVRLQLEAEQRSIDEAHAAAVAREEAGYTDPVSGLFVFTEWHHKNRGYCCGNGCRCPPPLRLSSRPVRPPAEWEG